MRIFFPYVGHILPHIFSGKVGFMDILHFRDTVVYEGMEVPAFFQTGDKSVDEVRRKARVVRKFRNYCLLQDSKGFYFGPTYQKLATWINK